MRDDFAIPNMGEAPQNYDKGHINRVVRNVEMTFRTAKSKGPATFTDLTAESATIANLNATASTIYKITVPRAGSEAVQYFEVGLSASAGHTFTGYSDTANAKPFLFNSTTNASNTVPSGGATGFIFRTLGVDRFSIIESTGVTGGISTNGTTISKNVANQGLVISGGNTAGNGANIELYGGSHATDANRAFYDAALHTFRAQSGVPSFFDVDATQFRTFVKVRLPDTGDVSLSSTGHAFQIGADNASNIRMDGNEIMSVNNGTVNELHLQADGGDVTLHQNATSPADFNTLILRGGRINFPATQNASSNLNTFDDYEKATFTPVLSFGGGTTGITYSIQSGAYVKIGTLVFARARIILTNKGSSTGQARLTVPFGNSNLGQDYAPISIGYYGAMVGLGGAFSGYVEQNSTSVNLVTHGSTGVTFLNETHFSNTSDIIFSVTYRANQ